MKKSRQNRDCKRKAHYIVFTLVVCTLIIEITGHTVNAAPSDTLLIVFGDGNRVEYARQSEGGHAIETRGQEPPTNVAEGSVFEGVPPFLSEQQRAREVAFGRYLRQIQHQERLQATVNRQGGAPQTDLSPSPLDVPYPATDTIPLLVEGEDIQTSTHTPVPEPGTCGLFLVGVGGLLYRALRRRQRR